MSPYWQWCKYVMRYLQFGTLGNVYAERIKGNEYALVEYHRTGPVGGAQLGVGGVAIDGVTTGQVLRVSVDGGVDGDT